MELTMEQQQNNHLRCVLREVYSQEETAETIVPDSEPDVGRIVDSDGTAMLRSKECRDGAVVISGNVKASVLYVPEDGSAPRTLEVTVPFSVRAESPNITMQSQVVSICELQAIDARIINSRKVLVRVGLKCSVQVFDMVTETFYPNAPQADGLQVRKRTCPVRWPAAVGEKAFVISDEQAMPSDAPAVQKLEKWTVDLETTDSKLVGNKAAFQGQAHVRALYTNEAGTLNSWIFSVPFSQFVELSEEGGEDDLELSVVLTGAELEPGASGSCLLTFNLLAQCVVSHSQELALVEDLYSLRAPVMPRFAAYSLENRLDRQALRESARELMPAAIKTVVDCAAFAEPPTQSRDGTHITLTAQVTVSLLYYDENDQLQGLTRRLALTSGTELAEGCTCFPRILPNIEVFAAPAAGGAELRLSAVFDVECVCTEQVQAVCGAEQSEPTTERRPSVILRAKDAQETLWSMAKNAGSTVDAILQANQLGDDEVPEGTMLLIPRVG